VEEAVTMAASVLVVEDEPKIRDLLRSYLEHDGLTVITTGSGAEAIQLARDTAPDLIVLDLRLPDVPGEEVAREVRAAAAIPIMMLTAKTDTADRIHGLELGADDYVTKPFSPREVVLRARAILRRAGTVPDQDEPVSYGGGQLIIDEARRQVTAGGQPATLTATEWKLLTTLASVPGRVYSRYELINRTRGYEYDGYERTIDSHIRNLRRKIEPGPRGHQLIETVTGAGYRLAVTRDHQPAAAPAARLPGAPISISQSRWTAQAYWHRQPDAWLACLRTRRHGQDGAPQWRTSPHAAACPLNWSSTCPSARPPRSRPPPIFCAA